MIWPLMVFKNNTYIMYPCFKNLSFYCISIDLRLMYLYQDSQILKTGVFMRWFNPNQSLENRFLTKTYICNDPIQPTYMWVAVLISDQEKTDKREIIFPIIILQTVAYWRMLQCRIQLNRVYATDEVQSDCETYTAGTLFYNWLLIYLMYLLTTDTNPFCE